MTTPSVVEINRSRETLVLVSLKHSVQDTTNLSSGKQEFGFFSLR